MITIKLSKIIYFRGAHFWFPIQNDLDESAHFIGEINCFVIMSTVDIWTDLFVTALYS